jgi:hypothetical protein
MKLKSTKEFCCKTWNTVYAEDCTLEHNCYLDKGHDGECVCGWCDDGPLEIHPYLEENQDQINSK